ncbi:MAG: TonB-dependent receptor [Weeksellaceae bacterium]|nr:TonB-dependent receptor [Weeksellaceae bacterium]
MKYIAIIISLAMGVVVHAQIQTGEVSVGREETIGQGSVTVERVYEPKVESAERIKQTPGALPESTQKIPVEYSTKNIEVASDFETSTIGAEKLPVKDQAPYNNYVRAGYGNHQNVLADAYFDYSILDNARVGGAIKYNSAIPNIPDVNVPTNQSRLLGEAFLKMDFDNSQFDLTAGGGFDKVNLYGISIPNFSGIADDQSLTQRFDSFFLEGKYQMYNHWLLQEARAKASHVSDMYNASETAFDATAHIGNPEITELNALNDLQFGASAVANVNTATTNFDLINSNQFTAFNVGIKPLLHFRTEILKLDLGANLQYNDLSGSAQLQKNGMHIFPHAELFISPVREFGFYGGVTGGLYNQRYNNQRQINPFLLSQQQMATTVNKIEFFVGLKGDVESVFKYDARAGVQQVDNFAFFQKNGVISAGVPFQYANSFSVLYDDVKRMYLQGSLRFAGIEKLDVGGQLEFQTFELTQIDEPWNAPFITASIDGNYKLLNERLILGSELFFVSDRKDRLSGMQLIPMEQTLLKAYLDLNANATFMITDRWAVFAQANNLLNHNYERFLDYRVQGLQLLGGVMFKF